MNRSLWYAGLLLLAAGVTLTAVPGGYSTITGGGEGIPAASAEAPVTLVATGTEVVAAPGTESGSTAASATSPGTATSTETGSANRTVAPGDVPIAALINDVDTAATVKYAASVDSDAVTLRNPNGTVTIPEGRQQRLFARCDATDAESGSGTLRVTIVRANVSDTTITNVELTTQFQYDCPGTDRQDRGTTA